MAILDRQGRLFGKVSILDIGAIAAILITVIGLFLLPGNNGNSIAQMLSADSKPVEVDMIVKGLSIIDPANVIKVGDKVSIIIRNQPREQVTIKKVEISIPKVLVAKTDGTTISVPDPRSIDTSQRDITIVLSGPARITDSGVVFGSEKVKIGTSIDIEGPKYIMRGSAMGVRY
ncbi:DUF4330 domain-containing protein [Tumidithrix elongata RA019]|uniref:DUF4330 domain-containing protein n=1 Tax=Tumidithrix elongata BACA0141 TaxID=2716417 RepID=A0AAW9PSX1_9CYAN|nr:DUF4330 domain-containing protein [Tumidithrix elongata RA019]